MTPWLWTGGTKEVRILRKENDPGRHGRFATVDGWVYTRPCRTKNNDVLLRVPPTDQVIFHSLQKENGKLTVKSESGFNQLEKNGILETARRLYKEEVGL